MPEPTTMATRNAVPTNSAVARRARSRSTRAWSAAASGRLRCRRAARRVLARCDGPQLARRHLDVGQDRVDLPRLAVGAVDPHLVLHRVATGHFVLGGGGEAFTRQAGLRGADLVGGLDLDAEVVQRAGVAVPSMSTSFSGGSAMAKLA